MKKSIYHLRKQVLSLSAAIICSLLFTNQVFSQQGVSINDLGTAPHTKAILDLRIPNLATKKGFLVPQVVAADLSANAGDGFIVSDDATAKGMLVYQTDGTQGFYYYTGTGWTTIGGGGSLGPDPDAPGNDGLTIDFTTPDIDANVENGLNLNGDFIKLGGLLTGSTTITQDNAGEIFTIANNIAGNTIIDLQSTGDFVVQKNGSASGLVVSNTGEVGVNTSPTARFDVAMDNGFFKLYNFTPGGSPSTVLLGELRGTSSNPLFRWTNSTAPAAYFDIGMNGVGFSIQNSGGQRMVVLPTGEVGIGSITPAFKLDVEGTIRTGQNGTDGQLKIFSEGTTDYTYTINPHATTTQDVILTLPPNDGDANQVLQTDGSGALVWATVLVPPIDLTDNTETQGATEGELLIGTSAGDVAMLAGTANNTLRRNAAATDWVLDATNLLNNGSEIGIGIDPDNATSVTKLNVAGSINSSSGYYYTNGGVLNSDKSPMNIEVVETLANSANAYEEIGTFTTSSGAHNLRISLTADESQFSIAKTYIIVTNNDATGNAWKVVSPLYDTGPFGSPSPNNFELLMKTDGSGILTLRVRTTAVGTAHTGTIGVRIESLGRANEVVFAASAGTGTDAGVYTPAYLTLSNFILNQTSAAQASAGFYVGGTGRVDGNFGIGVDPASATHKLEVSGKIGSNGINESSDVRYKTNISPIESALQNVLAMRGVTYNWRINEFPEKNFDKNTQYGLIAQELEKIIPELVGTDNKGYKSIEYSHIVPVLIEAIKEQQQIIDSQKSNIDVMKASLENVTNRLSILENNADVNSSKAINK